MKIAFLIGSINGHGGIARATSILVNNLSKNPDYDISIINYSNTQEEASPKNPRINYIDIYNTNINLRKGFIRAEKIIRRFLKENNIDILISCGALYFILGAISTKGLKTKAIAWEHSNFTSNYGHKGKKYNRKIGALLSDRVITLTKTDMDNYLQNVRKSGVDYIYNPIDPALIEQAAEYRADSKGIITVGNLNAFKNYDDLMLIAEKVFADPASDGWKWDIYGDGPKRQELEEKIKALHLEDKVTLKGRCENIYGILNDYSLYVCTSKSEGLPMSLIEAKAKKLPIVSFDIMTGPGEIIDDGKNGYLTKLHDIDGTAEKIIYLINSPETRLDFSDNTAIGLDKFSINNCIEKWNLILNETAKDR